MSAAISDIRGLSVREARYIQALVEDPSLSDQQALLKAGFGPSVVSHPSRVVSPEMRSYVERIRTQAIEASLLECFLDAKEVLSELIRQYAGLIVQETRIEGMLGHDVAELYDKAGALRAVADWPDVWRKQLVVEVESRESSERSHDGATVDKEGGWDKTGEIKKVKRESTLAIERELRACKKQQVECLAEIGRHVNVKAFEQPKGGDINIVVVTAERAREVAAARKRLAKIVETDGLPVVDSSPEAT